MTILTILGSESMPLIMTATLLVAIISLILTQRSTNKRLKKSFELQQKQAQETFFAEYTRRYQEIVLKMPDNEKDPMWIKYLTLYFDLCSEEFHLHRKGLISEYVWEIWEDGMKTEMKNPSYKREWKARLGARYSDDEFIHFVHHLMKDNKQ